VEYLKSYTEQEFVNIAVEILDREEGVDRDSATMIADTVFNRLGSANIRECIIIARLAGSDKNLAQVDRIIEIFSKYNPATHHS
jgi:hypothetical protein